MERTAEGVKDGSSAKALAVILTGQKPSALSGRLGWELHQLLANGRAATGRKGQAKCSRVLVSRSVELPGVASTKERGVHGVESAISDPTN